MSSGPDRFVVCVFCGARNGDEPAFREVAAEVGRGLARRGWTLVYGGGDIGMMGALARAALDAGGEVIGVIPRRLLDQEHGSNRLSRREVVGSLSERKTRMLELSDAFLALPGGLGTLDELFEVLVLRQVGVHRRPVGLLDFEGYFRGLLAVLDGMARHDFVLHENLDHLLVRDTVDPMLDALGAAMGDTGMPVAAS